MSTRLQQIVTIQAGYPFRGAIAAQPNGSVKVVQPKDISSLGELQTENLVHTELTGKRDADWLKQGDVLFISKGQRNIACYVDATMPQLTCAPSLFLLRVKPEFRKLADPAFIAWQLNQQPVQNYFHRSAEGSLQIAIRKAVLEQVEIALPPMAQQLAIVNFYRASLREHEVLNQLLNNRQLQMTAIAQALSSTPAHQ